MPVADTPARADDHGVRASRGVVSVLICLSLVTMLAMLDRYILTLLVGPFKADLGLSDTQVGLVMGLAFAAASLAVSLPAGWLADRTNRRSIVFGSVVLWSAMAAACGAARGFWPVFLARAGVGLGEGAIPPAAYSLIRDATPPGRRGLAFSVYAMANSVGAGLALALGGVLVAAIVASGVRSIPILGAVAPWRLALIIVGLGGAPLAALAFAFPDPGRRDAGQAGATFRETLALLGARRAIVLCLMAFSVLHAMLTGAISAWAPAIIGRSFGLPAQDIGLRLGAILMVSAPLGLGASGLLMDRVAKTRSTGAAIAAIAAAVVLLISGVVLPRSPTIAVYWVFQALVVLSSTVYIPVTSTVVSQIVPARATGKTISMFLLVQGVLGAGIAPVVAAMVSDSLFRGRPNGLAMALSDLSAIYGVVALLAAIGLHQALKQLKQETSE